MQEQGRALAEHLRTRLEASALTVDDLIARTRVSRTTVETLLGEAAPGVLSERVYLRGHLKVIALELELDVDDTLARFDAAFPETSPDHADLRSPRLSTGSMALAAGLAGVGILAVVLAFLSAV